MKTILDLLFVLNGALGLVCVFLVGLNFKFNRNVNIYLAILLFAASIRLILAGYIGLTNQQDLISGLSGYDAFLIGLPLPYLYLRNLTLNKSTFQLRDLFHFFLPILMFSERLVKFLYGKTQFEIDCLHDPMVLSICVFYFIIYFRLLAVSFWRKKSRIEIKSEQEILLKKWVIVLSIAFFTMGTKFIFSYITLGNSGLLSDNFIVLLAWMTVFIMILTSPSLLEVYVSQIKPIESNGSKLPSFWRSKPITEIANPKDLQLNQKIQSELDRYFLQISQFVETEKFFRKSDQTLNDFALKSKIPVSHLSYVFKYHSEVSFSDFRKAVRIQDALALIEEGYLNSNSLDSLSKEVGFYTYNSFYIAFKEVTGNTPQKYVSALTT
jgi:AraC-like DNA-binding protein